MIIDMHGHIFYSNLDKDKREVLKTIERYGVERAYISAIELSNHSPNEAEIDLYNNAAYQFERENPKQLRSYCRVNVRNRNAVEVARRGIEEHNAIGLKLLAEVYMDDPMVFPVIEEAIRHNVPVLIHASHKASGSPMYTLESHSGHIRRLARRYPEARIVMAHTGGNAYLAVKDIIDVPNVCIDISGSLMRAGTLEYCVAHLRPDRILFGSDFPYVPHAICAGKVQEAKLPQDVKEKIWFKNSLAVFEGGGV
ncbi:amidohydrolase family protein [Treponema sp. OttesenSCG-928-L16]|nr:amidohydrolase family protein [Treponema sp. OttesenSCG-928-L16]